MGGGAVSARRGARTVVKCTPMESLIKIYVFWLLGHRYSSNTHWHSLTTSDCVLSRQKIKIFQFFKILKNFQNWNFLKMHHIHMKPVSSLFELRWWSSSQKASKFSCEFKFHIENIARALPRALHAILSTPYKGKFQKIWLDLGRRRGFRAQGCAHGCEMHDNGIFDKNRCFLITWSSS